MQTAIISDMLIHISVRLLKTIWINKNSLRFDWNEYQFRLALCISKFNTRLGNIEMELFKIQELYVDNGP